ncbi:MAG: cell division transport system permease protein [Frankiaceae bacterium]|nr:cell division transport system permease protein [Frankiaceae bacterium]
MRTRFVLSEMAIGLRRNLSMTIAVVLTVAISLAGLGVAWLMREQVNTMKDFWYGKIEVSVFLDKAVTQPERDAIRQELVQLPQVQSVFYESQHQAYLRFKEQFKQEKALVANTDESALPESFRVKLHDPKKFAIVASAVAQLPGVDQVADVNGALKKVFRFFDGIQRAALVVAVVVLIVAILLIFNTVRLAAFSRRRETGIMRLVGASDLYIQGPFVLEGALAGLVGAGLALGLLALFKVVLIDHGLKSAFGQNITRYIGWDTVLWTYPWLTLTGVVIAGFISAATLQRYLRV